MPGAAEKLTLNVPGAGQYQACQSTEGASQEKPQHAHADSERAKSCIFLAQFVEAIAFTGIIVDSYQVCKALGASTAFSGLLVGLWSAGCTVGVLSMMMVLEAWPSAWRHLRRILLFCQSLDLVGASAYAAVLVYALGLQGDDGGGERTGAIYLLAGVRVVWGVGSGVVGHCGGVVITMITSDEDLPNQQQARMFWQSLGLGFGPMLAGTVIFLDQTKSNSGLPPLHHVGAVITVVQLLAMILVWAACPAKLEAWVAPPSSTSETRPASSDSLASPLDHSPRTQLCFLFSCFLLNGLRAYAIASAEVGTSLLLEISFRWDRHLIGFMIGSAFLACIPLRGIYSSIRHKLDLVAWLRIFSLIAAWGALLTFSRAARFFPDGMQLVVADCVMFPALYLGEGLTRGLMCQYTRQHAVLTVSRACCFLVWFANLTCVLAPWIARASIASGMGQDLYAFSQLICCLLFFTCFELGVRPLLVSNTSESVSKSKDP